MNTQNFTNQATAQTFVLMPQETLSAITSGIEELKAMIADKHQADANSQWIESAEARKLLGVSQKTWQTYRDNRTIPFSQFGRKIYVRRSDIEAHLQSHLNTK